MRILFLGDVVGRTGRERVAAALPGLRAALRVDVAIVNAENASHGFGLGPDMAAALFAAGADVLTLGNHAWDHKEIIPYIAETPRLIRAINFPPGTPGGGSVVVTLRTGARRLCCKRWGAYYMDPLDCPFRATPAGAGDAQRLGVTVAGGGAWISMPRRAGEDGVRPLLRRPGVADRRHAHALPLGRPPGAPGGTAFQSDTWGCAVTTTA